MILKFYIFIKNYIYANHFEPFLISLNHIMAIIFCSHISYKCLDDIMELFCHFVNLSSGCERFVSTSLFNST